MASSNAPLSYSAALSGRPSNPSSQASYQVKPRQEQQQRQPNHNNGNSQPQKRTVSPHYRPQHTTSDNEPVYVLTLLTDKAHHDRMTALRTQYFPRQLNKLEAHLTLFHALPGSKLAESITPVLESVAAQTAPFKLRTTKPFRLKKGIAISVAKNQGVVQAEDVHRQLKAPWLQAGFLSEQDRGGCRVHYTIMNKVDDEAEVARALEEVQQNFTSDVGTAEGLGLWRYDRGFWRWERGFAFTKAAEGK